MANGKLESFDNFKNLGKDFVGRDNELGEIRSHLSAKSDGTPRVLIVHALAGQGKTQIALEYSRQSQAIYRGIFWFNATSDITAIASFEKIATELQLVSSEYLWDASVKIRAVREYLENRKERWLMVLDSYDYPGDYPDLKRLIPSRGPGDVIITSRNKLLVGLGHFLEITPMTSDEGVRLLLRGRAEQDVDQHKIEWSKVVRRLGGLALALDQARAYLWHNNISIEGSKDFLTSYEAQRNQVLQDMPRDFWASKRTMTQVLEEQNKMVSAFTTWEMLFQQVESANPQRRSHVQQFLTVSAFFEPSHIGESIFRYRHEPQYLPVEYLDIFTADSRKSTSQVFDLSATKEQKTEAMSDHATSNEKANQSKEVSRNTRKWEHVRFWDLVRQLHDEFSLLHCISDKDSEGCSFSLHPLIRDWVQIRGPPEQTQAYTIAAIESVYASVVKCNDFTTLVPPQQKRLVVAHMDACVWNDNQFTNKDYRLGRHISNLHVAVSFSTLYRASDRISAALELSSAGLETRKQVLGSQHLHTIAQMENNASLCLAESRWKNAEDLQGEVIALKNNIYGPEKLDTLTSMVQLADIYIAQERRKEAEDLLLQVLEKRKKIIDEEQLNTMKVMRRLVGVYMTQHNWEDATELCSSIVEMRTRALGAEHMDTLTGMTDLARLYVFQGKRKEAEELEVQVNDIRTTKSGIRHADSLSSVMKLPSTTTGLGQQEAEELFEQERATAKRVFGAQLSDTERIRNILRANRSGFKKMANELLAQDLVLKESARSNEHSQPSKSVKNSSKITYSALDRGKQEIRLLTLYSGAFDDEIRCKLSIVPMNETLTYTALSYCWGDNSERAEVFVDEKKVDITKSLEIALRYARSDGEDLVLWVDAICINQENLSEKSNQVRMMGSIYANAQDVRIWLGESADNSDVAMDFVDQIHTVNFEDAKFELDPEVWKAVRYLFRRQWWTRVWVVQEVFLAKKPKFHCGRKTADRESFTLLIQLNSKYRVGYGARLRAMQSSLAGPFTLILDDWSSYKDLYAKGTLNLRKAITFTHENRCSEPVDKIFALLSMCKDLDRQVIQVDYALSARHLSIMVAKYEIIQNEQYTPNPLFTLQLIQANKDPTLPSWVPDYTQVDDGENHLVPRSPYKAAANNAAWTALGLPRLFPEMTDTHNSITLRIDDEGSFETLVLPGLIIDVVTAAFRTPWIRLYEGYDLAEDIKIKLHRRELIINACKEWESHVNNLPTDNDPYAKTCTRSQAFWRTLITDREIGQTAPAGSPAPDSDLAARFEAWMRRGPHSRLPKDEYEEYIRPFNISAVTRCMYRSFIVTEKGYLGLGSRNTVALTDYVCVLRGGAVPFVLRKRADGYWGLVGEAYVHGFMDGEVVRGAKKEDLRVYGIR